VISHGPRATPLEYRLEPDTNLLNGDALVRVRYRRDGQVRWSTFVVVLDEDTTYETVEANAETLISLYEAKR
jgi:hypothetical protein